MKLIRVFGVLSLVMAWGLPFAFPQTLIGANSIDVMSALKDRANRLSNKGAVDFDLRWKADQKNFHIIGRLAVAGERFLFESQPQTGDAKPGELLADSAYGLSYDGANVYRLVNHVKQVGDADQDTKVWRSAVAGLLFDPLPLLERHLVRPERARSDFFSADEIVAVKQDSDSGTIEIITDATKRSEFDRMAYWFRPSADWILDQIEMSSGGTVVAKIVTEGSFPLGTSGTLVHTRWTLTFSGNGGNAEQSDTVLEFKPIAQFAFESAKNFQLRFPGDAVDTEQAVRQGRKFAKISAVPSIITHGVARRFDDLVNNVISDHLSQFDLTLSESAAKPQSSSVGDVVTVATTAEPNAFPLISGQSRILALSAVDGALVILILGWAIKRARTVRGVNLAVRDRVVYVGTVAIALGTIVVLAIAWGSNPSENNFPPSRDEPVDAATTLPTSTTWGLDFGKRLYDGIAYREGRSFAFTGYIQRKQGVEEQWWQSGSDQFHTRNTKDMMEMYLNSDPTPRQQEWAPNIYAILQDYQTRTGHLVDLMHSNDQVIDLSVVPLRGPDLKSPLEKPSLKIESAGPNKKLVKFIAEDHIWVQMMISADDGGGFHEEESFFDEDANVVSRLDVTYK
jgi:hypothetical protein